MNPRLKQIIFLNRHILIFLCGTLRQDIHIWQVIQMFMGSAVKGWQPQRTSSILPCGSSKQSAFLFCTQLTGRNYSSLSILKGAFEVMWSTPFILEIWHVGLKNRVASPRKHIKFILEKRASWQPCPPLTPGSSSYGQCTSAQVQLLSSYTCILPKTFSFKGSKNSKLPQKPHF